MSSFISLCMIVKDEESVLNRCLNSVKNLVDEIIVVDTGSIDDTKNIALKYTDNVYDFEWVDDFSAARNFAQSKANGKWIIYLDADEYIEPDNLKEVIQLLKQQDYQKTYDAFVVTQVNFVGNLAGNVTQTPTVRIYKNIPTIHFERKIHEQLTKIDNDIFVGSLDLNIYHSGYLKGTFQNKNKSERNVSLIKEEMERNPNNGFDFYNLGNEYLAEWRVEEALISFKKAFALKDSIDKLWVPNNVERIIFCLIELQRYLEALDVIDDAIKQWPNTVDYRSQKGLIYFMQHRYEDAEMEMSQIVKEKDNFTSVQSLNYKDYLPYYVLGRVNEYKSNLPNSIFYYSQVLNYNDKDFDTLKRYYHILVENESKKDILDFIIKNNSMNNEMNRAVLLKIFLDNGDVELVENLLREWRLSPSDGFKLKLNLGKKRFNYAKSILSKNSIIDLLDEGWVDKYDIVMLAIQLNKKSLFDQLLKCIEDDGFNYLESIFVESKISSNVKVNIHYIRLLERCILLKNFKLIDKVISMNNKSELNADIGDLFFKYGFKDLALDFYGQINDDSLLDEQSFINIIEFFQTNGNEDEALKWAFHAFELNYNDFRIYKSTIEILNQRNEHEDIEILLQLAFGFYPDSFYLKSYKRFK